MSTPPVPTLIAGSRDHGPAWYPLMCELLESPLLRPASRIISGMEPTGFDLLGVRYAGERGLGLDPFPARWDDFSIPWVRRKVRRDGRPYNALAGFWRNEQMAQQVLNTGGQAALFWDGQSRGTNDMRERCERLGVLFVCWLLPAQPTGQASVYRAFLGSTARRPPPLLED